LLYYRIKRNIYLIKWYLTKYFKLYLDQFFRLTGLSQEKKTVLAVKPPSMSDLAFAFTDVIKRGPFVAGHAVTALLPGAASRARDRFEGRS
jgi:hypothetical protein